MNPMFAMIYILFQIWFIVGTFYFVCTNTFLGNYFTSYYVSDYTIDHYCGTDKEVKDIQNFLDNNEQTAKINELNKKEEARENAESFDPAKQAEIDAFKNSGGWSTIKGNR